MTSITKLSNLKKYNSKMMNYIHDTFLSKSTPKEIKECFGDLIDNFTGNGITKNGNVKIDENGIATNFINVTDYVVTNIDVTDLKVPFEVQVKFKVSNKAAFNELHLISNKRYAFPCFELVIAEGKIICESFKTQSYDGALFLFFDSF